MTKRKLAPRRHLTEAEVRSAIELVSTGRSLAKACEDLELPYTGVFWRINEDQFLNNAYNQARGAYLEEKVQEMNDIVLEYDPHKARLLCQNIQWEASRVMRKYNDRLLQETHVYEEKKLSTEEMKERLRELELAQKDLEQPQLTH
jgi:hypothetical protein